MLLLHMTSSPLPSITVSNIDGAPAQTGETHMGPVAFRADADVILR